MGHTGGMAICMDSISITITSPIKVWVTLVTVRCTVVLSVVEEEEKSISLSPQLTPTVNFKLIKNSYLNHPYTACRRSFLADKYIIFKHEGKGWNIQSQALRSLNFKVWILSLNLVDLLKWHLLTYAGSSEGLYSFIQLWSTSGPFCLIILAPNWPWEYDLERMLA